MKLLFTTTIIAILSIMSVTAKADTYINMAGTMISTDITDHNGVMLTIGSEVNSFLSVEGFALLSSTDDTYSGVNLKIDSLYGVSILAGIPITDSLTPFVSFGHTRGEATASYMGYSESASESGSSVGFGVKYQLRESWSVRAEYKEFFSKTTGLSFGLTAHF